MLTTNGLDHSLVTTDEPWVYKVEIYEPSFSILFFSIEEIHEKELLVDVKVTFDIYWAYDADFVFVELENQNMEQRRFRVNSTQRFHYQSQIDHQLLY